VLLRYLSDAYKTAVQTVPDPMWNDELIDVTGFLRSTLQRVDASLLAEWERMLSGEAEVTEAAPRAYDLARDPRMLRSRIRAELHILVKALAARDYEEATDCVRADVSEPWTPERFEQALAPFLQSHERLIADHRARQTQWTIIDAGEPRTWRVRQVLLDPQEDNTWFLEGIVDLREGDTPDGPLIELLQISS
jgi:hypothetical protein